MRRHQLYDSVFRPNTGPGFSTQRRKSTMIWRKQLFFGRLVLVFPFLLIAARALAFATSRAAAEENDNNISTPRFVLVEEHHHVVSHLVRFAREGFLRSHITRPDQERNFNGAILIHIDSHADMGLTPGLNHLPAKNLFSKLPPERSDEDIELLEHSVINDFLLLLGYIGIVEHIVFVEPSWSFLLNNAHYTTVDISMGVVPREAAYASIRNSPSTTFSAADLSEDAIEDLTNMMADDEEPVEIIPHEELLHRCPKEGDNCNLRTVKFTTLPYQGAAEVIEQLLEVAENKNRDIILDVDLDGFSTTSPGALSLFQTSIPDYNLLTRIFHTVHEETCDMDENYWEKLKSTGGSSNAEDESCESDEMSFVHGPSFQPPRIDAVGSSVREIRSSRSTALVEDLYFYDKLDEDGTQALVDVLDYYLAAIDTTVFDDEKFVDMMDSFLLQPFFVPEPETIEPILDFHFDHLFRTIFANHRRVPKVINVVRSPFYTPDHHLDSIECKVFDRLLDMFGKRSTGSHTLYHFDEVQVDRTNCLHEPNKFPPLNRFNIGANPHIDATAWKVTHQTYSWFFEDDDEIFGREYKFIPIVVDFVNEHNDTLLVKTMDGKILRLVPGQRLKEKVNHLSRWELLKTTKEEPVAQPNEPTTAPFLTIYFNGKDGANQSYGSISGRIPVHHSTPVKMEVTNPSGSGIRVALKTTPNDGSRKPATDASLSPGETTSLQTVHGERWTIYDTFEKRLGEVIANATYGEIHSVLLFSDEGASGSEL